MFDFLRRWCRPRTVVSSTPRQLPPGQFVGSFTMAYQPIGLPPDSGGGGGPPAVAGKDQQLMGNFTGVDVTCSSASVNYQAAAVPLAGLVEPNCRFGVKVSFSWSGLTTATKTVAVGYGRSFSALGGSASDPSGRNIISKTSTAAATEINYTVYLDIGSTADLQKFRQASTGDENVGSGSAPNTGVVLLSLGDSSIYVAVMSANAGDIIKVDGLEVWKTKMM